MINNINMTLQLKSKIKITPICDQIDDDKILRSLSYDQEPHQDNIYIIEECIDNVYNLSLNNRIMRFTLYYEDKWYYKTHDSILRQVSHIWRPKECIIEVL